ncbi:hypothetical protein [Flavobacterium sp.]|uniref:terminase small subunit-like protein n=1 Tax=Flavobacterium sp. TaxID=239 RepID=UPI0025F855CD|nr:hypothetical protein [Flavobacterium sp.]
MVYTDLEKKDKIDLIIDLIEEGGSIRSILKRSDTVGTKTFYKWLEESEELQERYKIATKKRADNIFEEMLEIADKQSADMEVNERGEHVINHNVINRSRLQIDTRKWMLGKMNPKKYGDKLDVTSDGDKLQVVPIVGMKILNEE